MTILDEDQNLVAAIERHGFDRGLRYMAELLEEATSIAEAENRSPDFVLALRNAATAGRGLIERDSGDRSACGHVDVSGFVR